MLCAVMVTFSVAMVSCDKESYKELIVGKWQITSMEGDANYMNGYDTSYTSSAGMVTVETNNLYMEYYSDGTGYKYQVSINDTTSFLYSISAGSLRIERIDGGHELYNIEKLNKENLRLSSKVDITDYEGRYIQTEYIYFNFKRE